MPLRRIVNADSKIKMERLNRTKKIKQIYEHYCFHLKINVTTKRPTVVYSHLLFDRKILDKSLLLTELPKLKLKQKKYMFYLDKTNRRRVSYK